MGIPKFFNWLRQRYPSIVDQSGMVSADNKNGEEVFHCFYIDMNHVIHVCTDLPYAFNITSMIALSTTLLGRKFRSFEAIQTPVVKTSTKLWTPSVIRGSCQSMTIIRVYGVDNDIILLALATHEPSLTILRDIRPTQPSQEESKHVSPPPQPTSTGVVSFCPSFIALYICVSTVFL